MKKPTFAIKLTPTDFDGCINMGNEVYDKINADPAFDNVNPAASVILSNVSDVVDAKSLWGNVHDRGSHAMHLDLLGKNLTLWQNLISLSQSVASICQVTCGSDYVALRALMNSSGFPLKSIASPIGRLEAPQNLRRLVAKDLTINQGKAKWKKPANARSYSSVYGYNIYSGTSADFSAATFQTSVTKASYLVENNTDALSVVFLFVVPFGAAGEGIPSEALRMVLPPM